MKAPDKIYIQTNAGEAFSSKWTTIPFRDFENTEYIRKDALVPDNLDEAAMEIVIKMHPCMEDCTILGDRLTRGQLMALVKAGAEWMAGQGYTVDGVVICDKELTRGYKDIAMSIPDELKVDDKVTIQIRKRQ